MFHRAHRFIEEWWDLFFISLSFHSFSFIQYARRCPLRRKYLRSIFSIYFTTVVHYCICTWLSSRHEFISQIRSNIRFLLKLEHFHFWLLSGHPKYLQTTFQTKNRTYHHIFIRCRNTFYIFRTVKPIPSGYRATPEFPEMSERTSWPIPLHQTHNNGISFPTLTWQLTPNAFTVTSIDSLPTAVFNPLYTGFSHLLRKSVVAICRLRFNHHCLPANLPRFILSIFLYYPLHPYTFTLATLNHIFFQCPNLQSLNKKFEQNLIIAGVQRPWSISTFLAIPHPLIFFAIANSSTIYLPVLRYN